MKGNIVVPKNASCTLDAVSITGDVLVRENASLTVQAYAEPSTIGGNIQPKMCLRAARRYRDGERKLQIQGCACEKRLRRPGHRIGGNFVCQTMLGACEASLG